MMWENVQNIMLGGESRVCNIGQVESNHVQ